MLQSLENGGLAKKVPLGLGQVEKQVVPVRATGSAPESQAQPAAGAPQAPPLAWEAVVLDEQVLDVMGQHSPASYTQVTG